MTGSGLRYRIFKGAAVAAAGLLLLCAAAPIAGATVYDAGGNVEAVTDARAGEQAAVGNFLALNPRDCQLHCHPAHRGHPRCRYQATQQRRTRWRAGPKACDG